MKAAQDLSGGSNYSNEDMIKIQVRIVYRFCQFLPTSIYDHSDFIDGWRFFALETNGPSRLECQQFLIRGVFDGRTRLYLKPVVWHLNKYGTNGIDGLDAARIKVLVKQVRHPLIVAWGCKSYRMRASKLAESVIFRVAVVVCGSTMKVMAH